MAAHKRFIIVLAVVLGLPILYISAAPTLDGLINFLLWVGTGMCDFECPDYDFRWLFILIEIGVLALYLGIVAACFWWVKRGLAGD